MDRYATLASVSISLIPSIALGCSDCEDERCIGWGQAKACVCTVKVSTECIITKPGGEVQNKVVKPVFGTVHDAIGDISNNLNKSLDDLAKYSEKAKSDAQANVNQAVRDTAAEATRFGRQLDVAGSAIVEFAKNVATGNASAVGKAIDRVREGKLVDALWGAAIDPIHVVDDASSQAFLTSDYLRAVGDVAASTYGGPGGAAAYAAWLTYRQTGDPDLAIRVGAITGATAWAAKNSTDIDGTVRKAITMGAIGGVAIAAAGGNEAAIKDGFLKGAAMVIVQDGYASYTGHPMSGEAASGQAYCLSGTQDNCVPLPTNAILERNDDGVITKVDMSKVDPSVPAVGLKDPSSWFGETTPAMTAVSRIPGMQAMAIFHDTWTMTWDNTAMVSMSIVPAVVVTYTGFGVPLFEEIRDTAVEASLKKIVSENYMASQKASLSPSVVSSVPVAPRLDLNVWGKLLGVQHVSDAVICVDSYSVVSGVALIKSPISQKWCEGGMIIDKKSKGLQWNGKAWITADLHYPQCIYLSDFATPEKPKRAPTPEIHRCNVVKTGNVYFEPFKTFLHESNTVFTSDDPQGCDAAFKTVIPIDLPVGTSCVRATVAK